MPAIFISHRHTDKQIADVINRHLRRWGLPQNSIYQSSAAAGGGPRIGEPLAQNLLDALYRANAVLLVYTFAEQDWSYCMWECGVATDPQSPITRIIVFQTTKDIPSVFRSQILTQITPEDILRFTTQFHRDSDFFPGEPAFALNTDDEILQLRSTELYNELISVIPPGFKEERYRWDCFTLKLNSDSLNTIRQEQNTNRKINTIQEESEVTADFGDALKHFGLYAFEQGLKFNKLVERWKTTILHLRDIPQEWSRELCMEMLRAIENIPAEPTWELMKSNRYPDWWFYPVVNHVMINPDGSMEFQIYMYRFPGSLPNNPI